MDTQKGTKQIYAGWYYGFSLFILLMPMLAALITRWWVLTAIPIGYLFGFFLQKGDLCGASAFSEVLLLRSWKKVFGLWICIVISMVGFALLDWLGWITLNPKPFLWMNILVGGILFGIGMVLAGGCVSGCLFKAGSGNLNSMAGLAGIPIGIAIVEYGPLSSLHQTMKTYVINMSDGSPVTLSSLTGLSFGVWTLIFAILTIFVFFIKHRSNISTEVFSSNVSMEERIFRRSWKPWAAGLAIGLLAIFSYLSSAASGRNYPLGVTHGVLQAQQLLTDNQFNHVWQATPPATQTQSAVKPAQPPQIGQKKIVWWLVFLILSLITGSFISGCLSGETKLLPKPPEQTLIAFFGGILVGTGAAFATGCVIGNILSGWALMSVGMFVFGIIVVLTNWITTYFYLMGGTLISK